MGDNVVTLPVVRVERQDVVCPFCGEGDFDRIGLKLHLHLGWCEPFNETPLADQPKGEG